MEERVERTKATGENTVMLKEILVENMTSAAWGVVLCAIFLNITAKLSKAIPIEVGQTYMLFLVMIIIFLCGFLVNAALMGIMGKGDVFRRWCCRNKAVMDFLTLGRSRTHKLVLQQLLELEHPYLEDYIE